MMHFPTIDMGRTGERIVALRKARGLSVRDIQAFFGFETPQAIYKWQHGTALPTVDNLVALAVFLQVPVDELLVVSGREPNSGDEDRDNAPGDGGQMGRKLSA